MTPAETRAHSRFAEVFRRGTPAREGRDAIAQELSYLAALDLKHLQALARNTERLKPFFPDPRYVIYLQLIIESKIVNGYTA